METQLSIIDNFDASLFVCFPGRIAMILESEKLIVYREFV